MKSKDLSLVIRKSIKRPGSNEGHIPVLPICQCRMRWVIVFLVSLAYLPGCLSGGPRTRYHDPMMDFGSIRRVAVMPLATLTRNTSAGESVRDVLSTMLMATQAFYVVPPGEVSRGIGLARIVDPEHPSPEEVRKLAGIIEVDAVITGVVREFGEVRSTSITANVVAVSLQMMDAQSGQTVWSGSTSTGGISLADRLFGSGGEPISKTIEEAVNDLLDQLFK